MRFQCGVKKWKIAISSNIKSGSRSIFRICQSVTQSVSHSFSFRHSVRLNSLECIFSAAAASLPPWLPACLLHSLTVSQSVSPELSTYIRPRPFLRPPSATFPPPSAVALQWTFSWTLLCCCWLSVRHLHSSYPVTHPDARPIISSIYWTSCDPYWDCWCPRPFDRGFVLALQNPSSMQLSVYLSLAVKYNSIQWDP